MVSNVDVRVIQWLRKAYFARSGLPSLVKGAPKLSPPETELRQQHQRDVIETTFRPFPSDYFRGCAIRYPRRQIALHPIVYISWNTLSCILRERINLPRGLRATNYIPDRELQDLIGSDSESQGTRPSCCVWAEIIDC
jgi:hypothetical protein